MAQQILKNNCYGVLAAGIAANTASIPLLDASQWPALAVGDWCLATLIGLNENGQESVWEIVKVTGKLNNTLTVERGQEGIAARAWPAGTVLQMRLTAGSVATPSLVEAVRLALLQMMADDRAQVDGLLGAKVDKNGAKVLSDNNFTNAQMVKLANIADGASNDRSKHTGVQPISSVTDLESRLDSALRVRLITSVSVQDFLAQAVALGPGYYRPYTALPVPPPIPSDSAGFLSLTADTFTLFFGNYITGKPIIFSGSLNDINLGTWKVFQIDDAAKLGVQSSQRDANRNKACTPGSFGWGVTPSVNSGDAGEYLSTATIDDASKWVSGVQRCISDKVPGGYADILRVGAGHSGDSSAWFHDVAFTTSGEIHARHKLNEDPWTSWEKFFTTKNAVGPIASSIIENGSNANGEYTKFADGTAMAWGYRLGYVAGDNYTPLPITFTGSRAASMSVIPSTGWQTPLGWYANNSQLVFNMPATNASNGYTFFVLGRWK